MYGKMNSQPKKNINIKLADGLHVMRTVRDYLTYDPNNHDFYAWGMWHWHTEGRFRERYAEKLTRREDV